MSIGIAIATFGWGNALVEWKPLAERAYRSAQNQTVQADKIVWIHGETLAQARNDAVKALGTSYAIICDADDELENSYVEKMTSALNSEADIYYPLVGRIYPDGTRQLVKYEPCKLTERNFCVIGSMFNTDKFFKVGGFEDIPIYEDWQIWLKMWKTGAVIKPSESIYVHHVNPHGRNNQEQYISEWYWKIRRQFES